MCVFRRRHTPGFIASRDAHIKTVMQRELIQSAITSVGKRSWMRR